MSEEHRRWLARSIEAADYLAAAGLVLGDWKPAGGMNYGDYQALRQRVAAGLEAAHKEGKP